MNLILLGAPGAGKGTQSKIISDRYGAPQIATGDILRAEVKEGTELGAEAKEYMDRGDLVPDELVVSMVSKRLLEDDCRGGFILDGFPRNVPQAESLEKTLLGASKSIDRVVGINVDRDVLVKRLSGRRVCTECGAVYHVDMSSTLKEGECDKCSGALYQRDDDKEETIIERLKVYDDQTLPLVEFYKGRSSYVAIDGHGEVLDITRLIVKAIGQGTGSP